MFENVLLVYKDRLGKEGQAVLREVETMLQSRNYRTVCVSKLERSCFDGIDKVISLGGDGTALNTAIYLDKTPILAINPERDKSIGAITDYNSSKLDLVKDAINGNYRTIQRQRADLILNGKHTDFPALNEVSIGVDRSREGTAEYTVEFNGISEHHKCVRMVVSTGTGSTGIYYAGEGVPFPYSSEELRFKALLPVKGDLFKPRLLGEGEIKKAEVILFRSERYTGGEILIDFGVPYSFNIGDTAEIRLSKRPLNVIVPV